MVIEAIAVGEYEAEEPTEEELAELDRLRVRLTPAATQAFIARAKRRRRRRPAAVPAMRPAAGSGRAPVSAPQRLPPVAVLCPVLPGAGYAGICPTIRPYGSLPTATSSSRAGCVDASNTTLRAFVTLQDVTGPLRLQADQRRASAVGLPGRHPGRPGGRRLRGLRATGWDVVPPTVLRDGPLGVGACQLWVDESPTRRRTGSASCAPTRCPTGWLTIAAAEDDDGEAYLLAHADDPVLARMALFDAVVNNADRKGGHVLYAATVPCGASTTASASTSRRSCARCCGAGSAGRCPTPDLAVLADLRRALAGRAGRPAVRAARRGGDRGDRGAGGPTVAGGVFPSAAARLAGGAVAADLNPGRRRLD